MADLSNRQICKAINVCLKDDEIDLYMLLLHKSLELLASDYGSKNGKKIIVHKWRVNILSMGGRGRGALDPAPIQSSNQKNEIFH